MERNKENAMSQEMEMMTDEKAALAAGGIPKNFRQQADMEAFYRFVFDNDLREEALAIFDTVRAQKELARAAKKPKH
jgi:hypothetical protein